MIKWLLLNLLILFFVVISSIVIHELLHQGDITKIKEICFLGYKEYENEGVMKSAIGWNISTEYFNNKEFWPTVGGAAWALLMLVLLLHTFKKELNGGKK